MKVLSLKMFGYNLKSIHSITAKLQPVTAPKMKISVICPSKSRSFMSEGQGLSCSFEGLSLKIFMFKFEDNPFKNNKVTANNSQKYEIVNNLTFKVNVIYE
jgi:hypothetical protein